MRPTFPPLVNWRGYGTQAALGMVVVAAIVAGLFAYAEITRLQRGMGSSAIAVAIVLLGIAVILLALYAANEHRRAGGLSNVHEARASAAWYALMLPICVLLLAVAYRTYPLSYPSADNPIAGPISDFSMARPAAGEIDLMIGVNRHKPVYRYQCERIRTSGWCASYPQILALTQGPPLHRASLVAIGQDLVMLNVDGRTVIDYASEKHHRLNLSLTMVLLGGFGLLFSAWGAFVYVRWARELSRDAGGVGI